jgi:hypothetical protein
MNLYRNDYSWVVASVVCSLERRLDRIFSASLFIVNYTLAMLIRLKFASYCGHPLSESARKPGMST